MIEPRQVVYDPQTPKPSETGTAAGLARSTSASEHELAIKPTNPFSSDPSLLTTQRKQGQWLDSPCDGCHTEEYHVRQPELWPMWHQRLNNLSYLVHEYTQFHPSLKYPNPLHPALSVSRLATLPCHTSSEFNIIPVQDRDWGLEFWLGMTDDTPYWPYGNAELSTDESHHT